MVRLIPIGAWCRTAHQARHYSETRLGTAVPALPFDWTITSFDALRTCLADGFDPAGALAETDLEESPFGSLACSRTGVIFHHDMPAAWVKRQRAAHRGAGLRRAVVGTEELERGRGRFALTMGRLGHHARAAEGGEPVFVRWMRQGVAPPSFPRAFEGESRDSLLEVLQRFVGHDRFRVIHVRSRTLPGRSEAIGDPIEAFEIDPRYLFVGLLERKGWNGDQTKNFRGDEASWTAMFDRALAEWDLAGRSRTVPGPGAEPAAASDPGGR